MASSQPTQAPLSLAAAQPDLQINRKHFPHYFNRLLTAPTISRVLSTPALCRGIVEKGLLNRPLRYKIRYKKCGLSPIMSIGMSIGLAIIIGWLFLLSVVPDSAPVYARETTHGQTTHGQTTGYEMIVPTTTLSSGVLFSTADGGLDVHESDIRGGHEATPGAWPWQAALVYANAGNAYFGQFCGGSLVAPEWVLTAAHCVEYASPSGIDVVLGRHKLSETDGERIAVDDIIIYPTYISPFVAGDLALLRLRQPSSQTVVSLDTITATVAEERSLSATVVGWGATDDYLASSDPLRQVILPLVALETCRAAYSYDELADEMLCAGYRKGAKSACYGDSGGPLLIPSDAEHGWTQVGIVSWGRGGCSGFENYNVYTRVAAFLPWIESCIRGAPNSECGAGDSYEPDNGPASAGVITTDGVSQTHNFESSEDSDWLQFEAIGGMVYRVDTFALGINSDTILWLYANDGYTTLAYNDDQYLNDHRRSMIVWKAPADGTYYLEVDNHWQGRRTQTEYDIRVFIIDTQIYLPSVNREHLEYDPSRPVTAPTPPAILL